MKGSDIVQTEMSFQAWEQNPVLFSTWLAAQGRQDHQQGSEEACTHADQLCAFND